MKKKDELINKVFFKKYKILKKIGEGSFGMIYLGSRINTSDLFAVKFESKTQSDIVLEKETYFLYLLRGFGIPEVITFGHNIKYNILIQTLLGNSINNIFYQNNKNFKIKDCCMIGIQILDRLEYIHSKYIIHRDIKPDNFLVGLSDTSLIYLIDFGLAKKYMSHRTGKHVKFEIHKKWSGTSRFASANSLRGVAQSRRDDLESFCYILLYLMKGSLPWDKVLGHSINKDLLFIYRLKKFMSPNVLFKDLPKETKELYIYCKKLDFQQKPDYNYLRSLLLKILNDNNDKNDLKFSWINICTNNLIKSQNDSMKNKYKKISKRKNSPQQRIYNSILNNIINKKTASFNELNFNNEINKAKKDYLSIKNISPPPREKNNNLFEEEEKIDNKSNNSNDLNIKKKVNKIKNSSYNENFIVKKQTEMILLRKFTDNNIGKNQNEQKDNNIIKIKSEKNDNNNLNTQINHNNLKKKSQNNMLKKQSPNNVLKKQSQNNMLKKPSYNNMLKKQSYNNILKRQTSNIMVRKKTDNNNVKKSTNNIIILKKHTDNNIIKKMPNNIIVKHPIEYDITKIRKNNIIQLNNLENKTSNYTLNNENENNLVFKNDTLFNNDTKYLTGLYNKLIIKENNSYNKVINPYKLVPNFKQQKIIRYQTSHDKNNNYINNVDIFPKTFIENKSYDQRKNNVKKGINKNNFLNNRIIQNKGKKLFNEKLSLNYNNKINNTKNNISQKINNNISPEHLNRFRLTTNEEKNKENTINLNKNNFNLYNSDKIKLNIDPNIEINSYNNKNNYNNKLIFNKKIKFNPQKNIKIINIISPIKKIDTYNKIKNNIYFSKASLYKSKSNYTSNNNSLKHIHKNNIINTFNESNSRTSLMGNNINKSLNDKFKIPIDINYNINNLIKQNKRKVLKKNSCYMNNDNKSYNSRNNIEQKNIIGGSFYYVSPKSIEKYKH